ncbi:MAG: carboxymuconolactone decarboxylase family protein, partial [Anaerolineae bacterium]|nr:carboxymuconolactone decarboxylase family protein [Anaerolineae bacterium]
MKKKTHSRQWWILGLASGLVAGFIRQVLCTPVNEEETALSGFPKRTFESTAQLWEMMKYLATNMDQIKRAEELLPDAFKNRLMLAVTQVNACRYCAYHFTREALAAGITQEEVDALLAGSVDNYPEDEAVALVYAQHWADSRGNPVPEARQELIAAYGETKAAAIEVLLRKIMFGNYGGNAVDYVLYKVSRGKAGIEHRL